MNESPTQPSNTGRSVSNPAGHLPAQQDSVPGLNATSSLGIDDLFLEQTLLPGQR
jgi:hypothetical protein